jgi:hypothetical protein
MDTLIHHIDRVTFQLSNRCPRAGEHGNCPASLCVDKPPENMSSDLVREVLETLGRHDFDGALAFHSFSEPLSDPHLFFYIEHAKQQCPRCHICLYTSGWNLDKSMLHDLVSAGVGTLRVTAYSEAEFECLNDLLTGDPGIVIWLKRCDWVPLLDQYERAPIDHMHRCHAPLTDVCITAGGKIGLCCRDWEHRYDLIDLSGVPFDLAMQDVGRQLRGVYRDLTNGVRRRAICQRCDHARWWNEWRGPAPTREALDG